MKYRELGSTGIKLPAVGLGCMAMSNVYGKSDDKQSVSLLHVALELGVTFWDTADLYGDGANESLISQVLKSNRDKVFLASKFGFRKKSKEGSGLPGDVIIDGSPTYLKRAVEASLKRLKTDTIDLYYLHRLDPTIPIEETVGAMSDLVAEGKVRFLGLCEVDADTLQRAYKVHPIAALQSEYSVLTRDVKTEVLPTARSLGVSLVPYAPLSRGMIAGNTDGAVLDENDLRRNMTRYQKSHYDNNKGFAVEFASFAQEKGVSAAQLALAWILAQDDTCIPIPGTKKEKYLRENIKAVDIVLRASDLEEIDKITEKYPNVGSRY